MSVNDEKVTSNADMMMMKNEFGEASSSASLSCSPPSAVEIVRTSSHSSNLHNFRQNPFGEGSSSSSVAFRSPSDRSLSSSLSNGLNSSEDGSPFASPPFAGTEKRYHDSLGAHQPDGLFHNDSKSIVDENLGDDLNLCENFRLMNIRNAEEQDKIRYENQTDGLRLILDNGLTDLTGPPLYTQPQLQGFNNGGIGFRGFSSAVFSDYGTSDNQALSLNHKSSCASWSNSGHYNSHVNSGFDHRRSDRACVSDVNFPQQNTSGHPYVTEPFGSSQHLGWQSDSGRVNRNSNDWYSQGGRQSGSSYNMGCNYSPLMSDPTAGYPDNRLSLAMKNLQHYRSENSGFKNLNELHPGVLHRRTSRTIYDQEIRPALLNASDVRGYVYAMAKDQHGCRFLQKIFDEGNAADASIIFSEVINHVVELMLDPFGNYLMQKLLDVCNEEQRTDIIVVATAEPGNLIRISLNAYGTRVVQRLVETIKTRRQISLVKVALRPGFLDLIKDLNGNHVIQRCLQCLTTEDNKFIFEAAIEYCVDIATHRHGCCVLQKCIDHSHGEEHDRLIGEISRNSLLLAQDPFGNYAVQFVIDLRVPSALGTILTQLKGHYVQLSMQKFSSHVVERCLIHSPESRPQIVRELISVPHFDQLLQDPYANFVIQAALTVTKNHLHASLVDVIRPHTILRNNPYCKRIFSRNLLKK